ncbi:MAG: DNA-formamidopyrimidine glycosylase family protein [Egibacteraceae bacterium]
MTLLPEAETLRKELEKEVVGQRITQVTVVSDGHEGVRRDAPDVGDLAGLAGQWIDAVIRQGTNLALRFKDGRAFVIRSGSVATLTRKPARADGHQGRPPGSPAGHMEIVFALEGGGALHYLDAERDGPVRLVPADELSHSPEFAPIGIDPFTSTSTWLEFSRQLVIRNCRLRALLGDDTFVVGLGDVYSDEILWAASLSGMRSSAELSAQEVRRLYRAIQEVLHEAIKRIRGVGDNADEDPFEDPLARQHLKVYGRAGQYCARCRQTIVLAQIDNPPVASYFCPNCQT